MLRDKVLIGGISHRNQLIQSTPAELAEQVRGLTLAMGTKRWMLGPGCTFSPETPKANLTAIRQAAVRS